MSEIKILYQTLENRKNPEIIEKNGPFLCNWENTWLGDGYYFWDSFINNAHWWGKEARKYKDGYIICKSICDYNSIDCFDLVGNTEHLQLLLEAFNTLSSYGLSNDKTTVKRVIEFLKDELKIFKYQAIRVNGILSKSLKSKYNFNLPFDTLTPPYLDLYPPIQICLYTKQSLNLRDYKIIFPKEYCSEQVV